MHVRALSLTLLLALTSLLYSRQPDQAPPLIDDLQQAPAVIPDQAPPTIDDQPQDGARDGDWSYRRDSKHPKGGYWWRFKTVTSSQGGPAYATPFVQPLIPPTTARTAAPLSTSFPGVGQFQGRTPTRVLAAPRFGTTNSGCTTAGG